MKPIRLLLVDDHFMVRMGLTSSLDQETDMEVVGEAANGAEAVTAWDRLKPDVTLMDGQLPDRHGVEIVREILSRNPEALIILLSVDETEEDIHRALEAGARSYLPKSVPRAKLLRAVRAVAAGESYLPDQVAERIEQRASRPALSERELEVLRLVARGLANKQIAAEIGLAEITVKVHVSRLLKKLKAPDRTRAVTRAIEQGIIKL